MPPFSMGSHPGALEAMGTSGGRGLGRDAQVVELDERVDLDRPSSLGAYRALAPASPTRPGRLAWPPPFPRASAASDPDGALSSASADAAPPRATPSRAPPVPH